MKQYDPSRLVAGPSGWLDRGYGDLYDIHRYPGISMFPPQADRATVLSEFGGLGLLVKDHLWIADRNWGYTVNGHNLSKSFNAKVQRSKGTKLGLTQNGTIQGLTSVVPDRNSFIFNEAIFLCVSPKSN